MTTTLSSFHSIWYFITVGFHLNVCLSQCSTLVQTLLQWWQSTPISSTLAITGWHKASTFSCSKLLLRQESFHCFDSTLNRCSAH